MGILKAKIVVVPLGEVDFNLVNRLASEVGSVFGRAVDIIKGMKVPDESFNLIRGQYFASVVMAKLERIKSNSREKVIAVCEENLYLPDENYVLGCADQVSGTAVVSLYQIRQEFYGLPENDALVYPRAYKETLHHLAHVFGLAECRNPKCVNYFSQVMLDIDNKGTAFCDICRRQLTKLV